MGVLDSITSKWFDTTNMTREGKGIGGGARVDTGSREGGSGAARSAKRLSTTG